MLSKLLPLLGILLLLPGCADKPAPPPQQITISSPYEIKMLDPHARNSLSNFALLSHFYEPLVTTDAGMKILPCLAKSWENPDQLTWIFTLHPEVKFHSGKALTSEDVVYSFQRLLKDPKLEMSGYLTDISDIRAEGDYGLRIHTIRPMNILLNKLRFVPIVPAGSTVESLSGKVDGTGPYVLEEWVQDKSMRMTRNEAYWGSKPALATVAFLLGHTPEKALEELRSGAAQFAQCNSKELEKAFQDSKSFIVHKNSSLFLKFISYDMVREKTTFCSEAQNPFRKLQVRRAIHTALNRTALVAALPIYAVPATQPLPPFVFGHNPKITVPQHNIETAKALMKEAGYENGFDVTMHYRGNVASAATTTKEQLAQIGIRIKLETLPAPEFLSALKDHQYSFFLAGMGCPTGDASDVLDNALHTTDLNRRYGVMNYGGYSNPDVDLAIEQSSQIQRMEERRDAIQKIMSSVMDDLAWIPVYIDQDVYAVSAQYKWHPRNDSFIFAWEITAVD